MDDATRRGPASSVPVITLGSGSRTLPVVPSAGAGSSPRPSWMAGAGGLTPGTTREALLPNGVVVATGP